MTDREKHNFYNSAAWQRKRMEILKRDHFECQDCRARVTQQIPMLTTSAAGGALKINRATCVHHIQELTDRPDLALAPPNLISLCDDCHNIRHGRTPDKVLTRKRRHYATEERW